MTNVCTQAGLRSNENRLLTPESMFWTLDFLDGDVSREEAPEDGGEGSRELLDLARPDSRIYGETDEVLRRLTRLC